MFEIADPTATNSLSVISTDCSIDCAMVEAIPVIINGCMDALACNFNPAATTDDDSCLYNLRFAFNPASDCYPAE